MKKPYFQHVKLSQPDRDWINEKINTFHRLTDEIELYTEQGKWTERNNAITKRNNAYMQVIYFLEREKSYEFYGMRFSGNNVIAILDKYLAEAFGEFHTEQLKEQREIAKRLKERKYRF